MGTLMIQINNIHVVIALFSIIGIESITVQIQATPSDGILGQNKLQLRCSYTTVTGEFVTGVNMQAKINEQFKNIAIFNTPSIPLNASLTADGNYLSNRVTLTSPTTTFADFAVIQFTRIECEDETEYMCQVAYAGFGGSTSANSGVANINVKGNPEEPDSLPSYVPSAGIEEGSNVVFTCTGNVGRPAGKFRWVRYRRNSDCNTIEKTSYESQNTTVVVMPGTCTFNGTSQLTLKMEHIDNTAVVRCQIVYQDVPQRNLYRQTAGINVYYSVRNVQLSRSPIIPSFTEETGDIILTNCKSDGNPVVTNTGYTWYKESNTSVSLWTGHTCVINNVIDNKTDNYICVAQNRFNGKTFSVNNSIHIQIDLTTSTYSTTMITTKTVFTTPKRSSSGTDTVFTTPNAASAKTETVFIISNTSCTKRDQEGSTMAIPILVALVVVLSVLQLGEIMSLYILHKKGIVKLKTGNDIGIYEDFNRKSTEKHIYSSMKSAAESDYNEIQ